MNRQNLLSRISINPNICFGKPCIKGHRIWVSLVLDFLASGMTIPELLQEYPQLQAEDIYACIAYVLPTVQKCQGNVTSIFRWRNQREAEAR